MFNTIRSAISTWYQAWRAQLVQKASIKEITSTLRLVHAQELRDTPGELWPYVKANQAQEILSVQAGNLPRAADGVDRRSWQFPFLPETVKRIRQPIVKMTPWNVRRFATLPVARRAINLVKNAIIALDWDIVPLEGNASEASPLIQAQIAAAKLCFQHPNNEDSYQSLMEVLIEDFCTFGALVAEPQITPDPNRPFKMWAVDPSTIRIFPTWRESEPWEPKYAQATGLKGERGIEVFLDSELIYLKDNPRSDTPFGQGRMEIAFNSLTALAGVQDMAGKAGADQTHRVWMWWAAGGIGNQQLEQVRRHITNDLEGQAKINLMSGVPKPDLLDVQSTNIEDLLLPWQEMLIRMIACAFDISAMALNLERDVNRSTGEVLDDKDFRSGVVPVAVKIAEGFTRQLLHKKLGYTGIKFQFLNLDDPDVETKMQLQQQLYTVNATTPNRILAALGLPLLTTPFAEMTQIEIILANESFQAELAKQAADQAQQRQSDIMDKQQQMMQNEYPDTDNGSDQDDSNSNNSDSYNSAKAGGVAAPKVPKAPTVAAPKVPKLPSLKPPKAPMAGSTYTAKQIAGMSLDEFKAARGAGRIPKDPYFLAQQMENSEPGVLENMGEELFDYLNYLGTKTKKPKRKLKAPLSPKAQAKLFRDSQHKPTDLEKMLKPVKTSLGKTPGGKRGL